ncbi:HTH-type transcriptional regulator BetI [Gordonia insulae]|uniref:HTH-type transcriptional regulator BetI n=2 Tax=Gordonia insulae TaxID=2420509 RepID=A0A3G8JHQ6_9ACTN|nr:HTH-type transcriptional regulator BetI [Gordonia insulae]
MRAIGRRAGVDPALIHHYFGNKEALLVAALRPDPVAAGVFDGFDAAATADPAAELVRRVIVFWEDHPEQRARAVAMLRVAVTHDEVAAGVRAFFLGMARGTLGEIARADHRERRISLVVTQMMGLVMARYVMGVPEIVSASPAELARQVGPSMSHYLFGDFDIGD